MRQTRLPYMDERSRDIVSRRIALSVETGEPLDRYLSVLTHFDEVAVWVAHVTSPLVAVVVRRNPLVQPARPLASLDTSEPILIPLPPVPRAGNRVKFACLCRTCLHP
jgi:hypothetical protein